MAEPLTLRLDAAQLNAFLARAFPGKADNLATVLAVAPGTAQLRLTPMAEHLRPGGIVSGPTLMALSDTAAYAVILAHIGEVAMAVTSSLTYQFLRACQPVPVTADATLIKLGRRLAVTDIRLWTDDAARPVGQATVTYAIP